MSENQELEWMKLEYDYAKSLIAGNKSARIYYLSFLITLNIAACTALYHLKEKHFSIFVAAVLFIINIILFLLYIRSHSAERDNMQQVAMIRSALTKEGVNCDWLLFDGKFKKECDVWHGWGHKLISILLSMIVVTSFIIIIMLPHKNLTEIPTLFLVFPFLAAAYFLMVIIVFLIALRVGNLNDYNGFLRGRQKN